MTRQLISCVAAVLVAGCGEAELSIGSDDLTIEAAELGAKKSVFVDGLEVRTGLRAPTREELAELRRQHVRSVKPNRLAIDRSNEARARAGLAPIDAASGLPLEAVDTETDDASQAEALSDGTTEVLSATATNADASSEIVMADLTSIDNSQLLAAPPILSQGQEASCVAFASTYYAMSHEHCLVRGCDNKNSSATRFSPRWTYNMINGGVDNGSSLTNAFALMAKHGAASLPELPYVAGQYRPWDLNSVHWRSAVGGQLNSPQTVSGINSDTGMQTAKQLLANGHVLSFGTYILSWQYTTVKSEPNTTSPYAGQKVAYVQSGSNGGHAMVFVGYDDTLWVDINNNGVVDTGERGAFKVANSWGTSWGNAGFMWLAYDALRSTTAVPGGPTTKVAALQNSHVYLQTAKSSYTPKLLARVTVRHALRSQLGLSFGSSSVTSTNPTVSWTPVAVSYKGGAFAFNGTTAAVDGTFFFDLSALVPTGTTGLRYYLRMGDNVIDTQSASVSDFRLIDVARAREIAFAGALPASSNGTTYTAWVDYDISTGAASVVDALSPTAPSNVAAALISSSTTTIKYRGKPTTAKALTISVTWSASTDNVGVTQYVVYRNGSQVGTIAAGSTLAYTDKSTVTSSGTYTYAIKAQDAAGNMSASSNASMVSY